VVYWWCVLGKDEDELIDEVVKWEYEPTSSLGTAHLGETRHSCSSSSPDILGFGSVLRDNWACIPAASLDCSYVLMIMIFLVKSEVMAALRC
jgi:hypothetical protein